jgi:hypothetical protein
LIKGKKIFPLLALLVLASCKKDHTILGTDVQPPSDAVNALFSDTATIYAHTVRYDSIPSFNDRYKFLGSNQDPFFGRTDVGMYLNVNLPNNITDVSFPNKTLISAEIILEVAELEFLGDNTTPMSYSVFAMTHTLDPNAVYYSNQNSFYNATQLLGTYTGSPVVLNDKLVLRIPIDNNFAKGLMQNNTYLANNAVFQNEYKGFYITSSGTPLNPVSSQGNIYKFDTDDDLSGFYIYYQDGIPSPIRENTTFRFTFSGTEAARYNSISYQPASGGFAALTKQILDKDTTAGKQYLFLKGLGGTRIKLFIPGLKNYADSSSIAVDRAELFLPVDPSFTVGNGQYSVPPLLALLPIGSDSKESFAIDELTANDLTRYDGTYNSDKNAYVFNIARHVQAILRGQRTNFGFYVVIADPNPIYTARRDTYLERVVLCGTKNSINRPKFTLSYEKLNN